jgi:hypothetical protein
MKRVWGGDWLSTRTSYNTGYNSLPGFSKLKILSSKSRWSRGTDPVVALNISLVTYALQFSNAI